ncbi:MAG: Holliday junction branch migration protein RuvA [Bdellovibrionales bacterium]|jgi:holliday junction DNA helicase RuvA|nr:Holliday junction branch migration protein RuvA [Bdellovibrionales bacterium]MBT3525578.1 Holliday junction branch migration protein RuvA [Bdellovibrionales bacterium]MBT7669569.1 Holliday junction branch migration protein RuvA [Bdellovibrionales bacterium]MBT7765970.1 Holliday junction branch migration protein RuvA [Bdellovibrionales bacterium]
MIGHINGKILFSDGSEILLATNSGIGYQIFCSQVLPEGEQVSLYIAHVIKEDSQSLFGFSSLREKKLFELLLTVKGVGPKSAFSLVGSVGFEQVCEAITLENRKILTLAPGVGNRAAAQIILDLAGKILTVKMYSDKYDSPPMECRGDQVTGENELPLRAAEQPLSLRQAGRRNHQQIINDTIMACKELGFSEQQVLSRATKIMREGDISKPEQLVHLVLKGM